MAIKLQVRRDILSNWNTNQTVVLLEGEIGYVTDTRNMKIGDGTTQWQFLKYQAPFYTGTNSSLASTTLSVDQSNNRVGIGTAAPGSLLDVAGGQVRFRSTGAYSQPDVGTGAIYYDSNAGNLTLDARAPNGNTTLLFRTSNGGIGAERMRIDSAGNVGIATTSPAGYLGIVGDVIIGNQTSTGTTGTTRLVSSAGINYIQSAQAATAGSSAPLVISPYGGGAEWMRVTSSGVSISGTTTSSGLITASAGLTVPTGQALTVAGSGTVSVPSGSITGVAITANTLAPSKISNMAEAGVLGATAAGAVTALTSGSGGTAKTALGLGSAAYTNGSDFICALNQVGQIAFVSFDVTSTGTDAGVYTGVTSSSTTGPRGGGNNTAPTYVSFGGTTTWSKGGATYYVRPNQGTWTCIQTNNTVSNSTVTVSMICIRTA